MNIKSYISLVYMYLTLSDHTCMNYNFICVIISHRNVYCKKTTVNYQQCLAQQSTIFFTIHVCGGKYNHYFNTTIILFTLSKGESNFNHDKTNKWLIFIHVALYMNAVLLSFSFLSFFSNFIIIIPSLHHNSCFLTI